jgi:hypothetical protein
MIFPEFHNSALGIRGNWWTLCENNALGERLVFFPFAFAGRSESSAEIVSGETEAGDLAGPQEK